MIISLLATSFLLAQAPATTPALPPFFPLPPTLGIKADTLVSSSYEASDFELRSERGIVRNRVEGPTWKFILKGANAPMGALSILDVLKPALIDAGWIWQWEDRGIAKLDNKRIPECWLRVAPGFSGEVTVLVTQMGEPRVLELPKPGLVPERPAPQGDFVYLPPWPGATLLRSDSAEASLAFKNEKGEHAVAPFYHIVKEYRLSAPPATREFIVAYTKALAVAGWDIEGGLPGAQAEVCAIYVKDGRDIRATIRLQGETQIIIVADVGAQLTTHRKK